MYPQAQFGAGRSLGKKEDKMSKAAIFGWSAAVVVIIVAVVLTLTLTKKQGAFMDGMQTDPMPGNDLTAVYGSSYPVGPAVQEDDKRVAAPLDGTEDVNTQSLADAYGPGHDFNANNFKAGDNSAGSAAATPQAFSYSAAYPGLNSKVSNASETVKPRTGKPLGKGPRIEVISHDNSVDYLRPLIKKPSLPTH